VDVTRLPLRGINRYDDVLRVGALATMSAARINLDTSEPILVSMISTRQFLLTQRMRTIKERPG
jgi:CO/xanthine dehydrogenase FAD-binding subunit